MNATMPAMLETRGVCKSFGGLKAVDDVSIQVRPGEIFGVIGPNGAGKTTLFNLLTGTYAPTAGEILFKGRPIGGMAPEMIARMGLARTFQNVKLFKHMTALDNVKVGFHTKTSTGLVDAVFHTSVFRRDEQLAAERGLALLTRVGLGHAVNARATDLPYGTQRRLEIARALATDPELVLLDEPAAGMNPSETADLIELVRHLNGDGLTIMVIEHDMKVIMNLCSRIAVLNYGRKVCEGTPTEVQSNQEVIEAYLGTRATLKDRR